MCFGRILEQIVEMPVPVPRILDEIVVQIADVPSSTSSCGFFSGGRGGRAQKNAAVYCLLFRALDFGHQQMGHHQMNMYTCTCT